VPRYPFRCETCGLEFEVSRPMSGAAGDAECPEDGARATRIFEAPSMNFGRPASTPGPTPQRSSGFSHHGHRHGAGTGHHSHGPARGPSAGA